jgi:hypothetical protein
MVLMAFGQGSLEVLPWSVRVEINMGGVLRCYLLCFTTGVFLRLFFIEVGIGKWVALLFGLFRTWLYI